MTAENPFRHFEPWEFEFGEDIGWTLAQSDRAKWSLRDTQVLWGSFWKMLLPLMRRDGITEIFIRDVDRILVETRDGWFRTSLNFDPDMPAPIGWPESAKRPDVTDLLTGLGRIHSSTEKKPFWSAKAPMGDVRVEGNLEDGSRLCGLGAPCVVGAPVAINIRRFSPSPFSLADFVRFGSMPQEAADCIRMAVQADCSMVVSAGTGAGKTTLLQAAMEMIPQEKVPLTIEDTPELQIGHWLASGFRTRAKAGGGGEDFQEVGLDDLLEVALRARPDWIICGEIRDPKSADQFVHAISSGHSGACTLHAHDAFGSLQRLLAMLSSARTSTKEDSLRMDIGEAIRLIVVLERVGESQISDSGDRVQRTRRRVKEIVEVLGAENGAYVLNPLFRTRIRMRRFAHGGASVEFPERYLEQVGIPFFGLEIQDRGVAMPDWWEEAKFQHVSKIPQKGRVALAPDLLDLACSMPLECLDRQASATQKNHSVLTVSTQ